MSSQNTISLSLIIGNILEWYDFALYGFFTHVIASVFFPQLHPSVALLATLGGFSAGFLMRPLGGWLLGKFGDTYGKKKSLMLSLILMFFPAVVMTFIPVYQTIGLWAPVLLLLARLLQGFSAGGELAAATYTLVESSNLSQKNKNITMSLSSAYLGVALAAIVSLCLTFFSDHYFLVHYAWRIGFGLGAALSVAGLVSRYHLFLRYKFKVSFISKHDHESNFPMILKTILIIAPGAFVNYFLIIYVPTLLVGHYHFYISTSIIFVMILMLSIIVVMWILQRYFRIKSMRHFVFVTQLVGLLMLSPVLYGLFSDHLIGSLISMLCLSVFFGCYAMPMMSRVMGIFSSNKALQYFGISYNLAYVLFGSTAPLIAHALLHHVNLLIVYIVAILLAAMWANFRVIDR